MTGSMPSTSAPAAPVKPSSEIACTAKLAPRVTTNMPIAPETTATTAPASSAVWTKCWPSSSVNIRRATSSHVVDVLVVGRADDDDAAADAQHVDRRCRRAARASRW